VREGERESFAHSIFLIFSQRIRLAGPPPFYRASHQGSYRFSVKE